MGIGLRIKSCLRAKGLTIKQLSEQTGISLNTLYSITKRDSDRIDPVLLKKIAEAIGVSETYILNGTPRLGEIVFDKSVKTIEIALDNSESLDMVLSLNAMKFDLLRLFNDLNDKGQQVAVERVEELTKIPDYQRAEEE